ncbi:MAG: hypothetical protein JWP01_581 [Myxococcales bacterium]|nr:hypothetical protein [Myxococcales bacterium]
MYDGLADGLVRPQLPTHSLDMALFHITTCAAWESAQAHGEYSAPSLATEGFIHLSEDRQWLVTANRFYCGVRDLVLLEIDADRLSAEVRREPADGDHYPHLYGALNLDAVTGVFALPLDDDGAITLPPDLGRRPHRG